MKRVLTALLLTLALVSGAWAQAKPEQAPLKAKEKPEKTVTAPKSNSSATPADSEITTKVRVRFLKNAQLQDATINVATKNGVVTLTGTIKKASQKTIAESLATSVEGVKKVENQLVAEGADKSKDSEPAKTVRTGKSDKEKKALRTPAK